jgi:hypothetical protein
MSRAVAAAISGLVGSGLLIAGPGAFTSFGLAQAPATQVVETGKDVSRLIEQAGAAEKARGRELLQQAVKHLSQQKPKPAELAELAARMAKVLPSVAQTPDEVREILAPHLPEGITRQIFYRRYLEQWVLDRPLQLRIAFSYVKGQEPRIQTVHALPLAPP